MTLTWLFVASITGLDTRPVKLPVEGRAQPVFKYTPLSIPKFALPAPILILVPELKVVSAAKPVKAKTAPSFETITLVRPRELLPLTGKTSGKSAFVLPAVIPSGKPAVDLNAKLPSAPPVKPTPTSAKVAAVLPAVTPSARSAKAVKAETSPNFGSVVLIPPATTAQGIVTAPELKTNGNSLIELAPQRKLAIEDTVCDVVCSNTDLNGVLSMLSTTTKANLVAIVASDQKLSLSLRRVKLGDALKHISSVLGLTFIKANNAFLVGPAERLKEAYPAEWAKAHPQAASQTTAPTEPVKPIDPPAEEERISRTYHCSYTLADGLKQTLKDLYAEEIKVAVGPPSITPTLGDRDTAGATGVSQGLIDKDGKAIGRALVLHGRKSLVLEAIDILRNLDQPRAQVGIQVTIHDIADNALNELGASWNFGGTSVQETDPRGLNFGSFTRTPFNFGATIKALEVQDKAKMLASPNVTVLDGERAFVLIGNKLTLPKFSGYDANKIPMYDTSEYKVGIYLQVAATVSGDGTITLSIYPQVSTVVKTTEINGASYPDIATREAQTSLRVRSGETILLGGLLRTEEISQMEQVPLLSKIPIFGELFKRRKKTSASSQVVISLTPTLIPPTTNESR